MVLPGDHGAEPIAGTTTQPQSRPREARQVCDRRPDRDVTRVRAGNPDFRGEGLGDPRRGTTFMGRLWEHPLLEVS